ncbi:MAG: hemolysin III family protein [Prevotella sp.]|nr:hemolysin III family protein [Prevotella sp.]MDY4160424.1 hemolysin III family protein [Prevotella sp.]
MSHKLPSSREQGNTWTHLAGAVFALSSIWMVWPAVYKGWEWAFGVIFFITGMFLMFLSSTIYHWVWPGRVKQVMRKIDHISIYVMIACSYTPICVSVIGGWLGWLVFGLQWAAVIGGTFYKVYAMGKLPKLSLAIYLLMGWSVLLIIKPVWERLSVAALVMLLAEGVLYTAGTFFFTNDNRRHFHAIWHIFVLLGAMAHWTAVLLILLD